MGSTSFERFRRFSASTVAKWRQAAGTAVLLGAAAILAGCAGLPGGGLSASSPAAEKEAAVRERADARWKALLAGDLDAAYAFLSPGSREVTPLVLYKVKVKVGSFREAKVDSVQCEAESCQVKIWLTYDHRVMKGVTTPVEETWVLDRGQFWFVYRG